MFRSRRTIKLLFIASVLAINAQAASSLDELRDPLHPGQSITFTGRGLQGAGATFDTEIDYSHTIGDDAAIGIGVPIYWSDKSLPNAVVPRVGGGIFNHIYLDGTTRFMGDEQNYFDASLDIGLPIQNDTSLIRSLTNTWMFSGTLFGHYRFGSFALEGRLIDAYQTPVHFVVAGNDFYTDVQNTVTGFLLFYWYPTQRWDLFVSYQEVFPLGRDSGTDNGESAFISSTSMTARTRFIGGGTEVVLAPESLLVNLQVKMIVESPSRDAGSMNFIGGLKWVF